jgi:hypothetical protein
VRTGDRPRPRDLVDAGRWDLESWDPRRHEDPPDDLETEEPAEEDG